MAGAETPLRLGTRGSALALAQAKLVADAIDGATEVVTIRTAGDEVPPGGPRAPAPVAGGDKARFVREIERALIDGEVDLAVHSAKDVPTELPGGLEIAGVPAREEPLDVFVGPAGSPSEIADGARIGTSSPRRRAQLLAAAPALEVVDIRGNVDTRLSKLADGDYDGIVLAAAGLRRLGRGSEAAFAFGHEELTPAAGQGCIAVEARSDDPGAMKAARALTDQPAYDRLACERAAVSALGATCDTPVGALARVESGRMAVAGFCGLPDGSEWIRDEVEGDARDPEALGRELASRMIGAGAEDLLERAATMSPRTGAS